MLAPDTCAGLLVSGLQNLPLFFDSKSGRIIIISFPVIQFAVLWLWRTGLAEAQELAVAIAIMFAVILFLLLKQAGVIDDTKALPMCLRPSETTSVIANAKRAPRG
jgi:hypothetical protein